MQGRTRPRGGLRTPPRPHAEHVVARRAAGWTRLAAKRRRANSGDLVTAFPLVALSAGAPCWAWSRESGRVSPLTRCEGRARPPWVAHHDFDRPWPAAHTAGWPLPDSRPRRAPARRGRWAAASSRRTRPPRQATRRPRRPHGHARARPG